MLKAPKAAADPQQAIFDKMAALWRKADDETQRRFLDYVGSTSDLSFLERAA